MPTPEQIENAKIHVFVANEFHGDQPDFLNFELERLAADPLPPTLSRLWYSTTEECIKAYVLRNDVIVAIALSAPSGVDGGTY